MEEFSTWLKSQRHEARATDSQVPYPLHDAQRAWQEGDALIAKLLEDERSHHKTQTQKAHEEVKSSVHVLMIAKLRVDSKNLPYYQKFRAYKKLIASEALGTSLRMG